MWCADEQVNKRKAIQNPTSILFDKHVSHFETNAKQEREKKRKRDWKVEEIEMKKERKKGGGQI